MLCRFIGSAYPMLTSHPTTEVRGFNQTFFLFTYRTRCGTRTRARILRRPRRHVSRKSRRLAHLFAERVKDEASLSPVAASTDPRFSYFVRVESAGDLPDARARILCTPIDAK